MAATAWNPCCTVLALGRQGMDTTTFHEPFPEGLEGTKNGGLSLMG